MQKYGSLDVGDSHRERNLPHEGDTNLISQMNNEDGKDRYDIKQKEYPEKLTIGWRLAHSIPFAVAGILFFVGSFCYYPRGDMAIGGIIFVIGGAAFLFADTWEWWKNNRVGCIYYEEYHLAYERSIKHLNWDPEDTDLGKLQRAENGLNFTLSIFGSFLYFLGAFFFLPPYTYVLEGIWIFITGSAIIVIAQTWKVYRNFYVPCEENLVQKADWSATTVDILAGLGGFSYFFGSILFLPWIDIDDAATILAANWFSLGGLFYASSGVFLLIRYFCYDSPLYSDSDDLREITNDGALEAENAHTDKKS